MQKKGQFTTGYMLIFELILAAIVAYAVFEAVNNMPNITEAKFFSRDIALLLDSISSQPGNILFIYNPPTKSLSKFDFSFSGNKVNVGKDISDPKINSEAYPYFSNSRTNYVIEDGNSIAVSKPSLMHFVKSGDIIKIASSSQQLDKKFNPHRRICGAIPNTKSVTIDIGHGWSQTKANQGSLYAGDKGYENVKIVQYESEQVRLLAQQLSYANPALTFTRSVDVDDYVSDRMSKLTGDVVISLHANSEQSGKNNIKAFINADSAKLAESSALACSLINAMTDKIEFVSGSAIIPSDISFLPADDPRQVLLKDKIAVYLELGNVNEETNNLLQKNGKEIVDAFKEVVK